MPSTIAPSTTVAATLIPAGVVLEAAGQFPVGFVPYGIVERDEGFLAVGAVLKGTDLNDRVAATAVSDDLATWTVSELPDPSLAPPPGHPELAIGYTATNAAVNEVGTVIVGNSGWARGTEVVTLNSLWFQPAGSDEWTVVDARDSVMQALGTGDSVVVALGEVSDLDGVFVIGAAVTKTPLGAPSRGAVLVSSDGLTWTTSSFIDGTWSTRVSGVRALGDEWIAAGGEYVCDVESNWMNLFGAGFQTRLWRSTDHASTWTEVDVPPEVRRSAVLNPGPGECPEYNLSVYERDFADHVANGIAGDQLVLWSADRSTAASTSGGMMEWEIGTVPPSGGTYPYGTTQRVLAPGGVPTLFSHADIPGVAGRAHVIWTAGRGEWQLQPRDDGPSAAALEPFVVGDAIVFAGGIVQAAEGIDVYVSRPTTG